jgi:hypothetical protein
MKYLNKNSRSYKTKQDQLADIEKKLKIEWNNSGKQQQLESLQEKIKELKKEKANIHKQLANYVILEAQEINLI